VQRLISVGALAAAAAIALLASACYSYVPHAAPLALHGEEVRVHLSPAGAADLAREIGPRMASIDARIIEVGPDSSLTLAVSQVRSMRGEPVAWQGDAPLVVPRSAIASMERRQLARGRTVVASTGAAAALAAIGVFAVRRGGKGSGTGGPPPPPPP
jgi:hypothetical protein